MKYNFELCKGRHSTPATSAIFAETLNPLDTSALYDAANAAIPEDCTELTVYVTGLTVAMLAVVNVCMDRGISMTAMHYNRDSGTYYPQPVTQFTTCPFCRGRIPGTAMRHAWYCPHCGAS